MPTRFVTATTDQTGAINALADLANQTAQTAYNAQTTGARTLTAAQFVNGIVNQGGTPGAIAVTTPTAAAIVAALKNAQANSAFDFVLLNNGDNTVTITAGSGVTLVGTVAVPAATNQIFRGVVTVATSGSEAVTLVGLIADLTDNT